MSGDGRHPGPRLSAYADGELPPAEAEDVEEHVEGCTECRRELAAIRTMGDAMSETGAERRESVWEGVRRRLVGPAGWILVVGGVAVLAVLAALEWFRTGTLTPEWLATTAVGVGIALVAVSIGWQQYREWRESPYRDVRK